MITRLHWQASLSASALHSANGLLSGQRLKRRDLADCLLGSAQALAHDVSALGIPRDPFFVHAPALAAGIDNNVQLAECILLKTLGGPGNHSRVERLAGRIGDLEAAFGRAVPQALDSITQDGLSMKAKWDEHGSRLLPRVAELTGVPLIPERADVILVYPALGGGGAAHLLYNSIRLEVQPTDPCPELPEVVRIAWLLSQLNVDLPDVSEGISGARLPQLAGLAMIPIVLHAAQSMDLASSHTPRIKQACLAWLGETMVSEALIESLLNWWSVYTVQKPPIVVALTALDQMLGDEIWLTAIV